MSENGSVVLRGKMDVVYLGKDNKRQPVTLYFATDPNFVELYAYIKNSPYWDFSAEENSIINPEDLIPKVNEFPSFCPVHGAVNIQRNTKKGKHTHYCAVKVGQDEWCGQKIYRFDE